MEIAPAVLNGIVHGKTIELEQSSGLPEGQQVHVTIKPLVQPLPPGEGICRSEGAWSDDGEEVDKFLEWNRLQRKASRLEIAE